MNYLNHNYSLIHEPGGGGRKLPYLQNEAQFQNPSLAGHQAGRQAVEEGARTGENGGICQFYK